jgi:hypothetical protein
MNSVPGQHCAHCRYHVDRRCYTHLENNTNVSKQLLVQLHRVSGADGSECPEMAEAALNHRAVVLHLKRSTGMAYQSIVYEMCIP